MRNLLILFPLTFFISCQKPAIESSEEILNQLATEYVQLGLAIAVYDPPFIDAYYGPDSLKPTAPKLEEFPKDSFLTTIETLQQRITDFIVIENSDSLTARATFIKSQLLAYKTRVNIFTGEFPSFDEESLALFGVIAPNNTKEYFDKVLEKFDKVLPGKGSINERYNAVSNKFIIPVDKIDTVLKAAIAESRARTLQHIDLPAEETFKMELVKDKPWGGYNWYQGNYTSLIQINTDLPVSFYRAIDVGSHESYPGHHVFNMLLEKNLYRGKGWVEVSMYPLFSPQSLIAEGSANFGIEMIFPGEEKANFCKEVLLPLAGVDTTGISLCFKLIDLQSELSYAGNEAGRGYLNGTMSEEEAIEWKMKYELRSRESAEKSMDFLKTYRTYIINYNYGKTLVKDFIETNGGTPDNPEKRWELFTWLISNEVLPVDLMERK